jgi:ArsR family transcriptional regulator
MNTTIFEALADENRAAIVELLADGELCVCDVSASLGISNALASHHLKKLREAGLVVTRRKGSWLHCRLENDALAAAVAELQGLAERGARANALGAPCCVGGDGDD